MYYNLYYVFAILFIVILVVKNVFKIIYYSLCYNLRILIMYLLWNYFSPITETMISSQQSCCLKGYSIPKSRSNSIKARLRNTIKGILDKNQEICDRPIDCRGQEKNKKIARVSLR